jgi:hypothetical protein
VPKRAAGKKAPEKPKSALKAEGSFLKGKAQPKGKKQAHFETDQSDSE